MGELKTHLSIVFCGQANSGKSTLAGRLIFELGGVDEREMIKLKEEAARIKGKGKGEGKGKDGPPLAFAFFMDRQKEERERGMTISSTTREFFTRSYHYTIIDAPGHRDFIKNMITGAAQADCATIMVPADSGFIESIQRGNHKAGEVQGQTRQHARLINLLGIKQISVCISKMDSEVAYYSKDRYEEVASEMMNMLMKVGWKKDFVLRSVAVVPISGMLGDNLFHTSEKMPWWKGINVTNNAGRRVHVDTFCDVLEYVFRVPERPAHAAMRMPISGIYHIKGVGDVVSGRVEQGQVEPGKEVVFMPSHTMSNRCGGKIFTVEMHHKRIELANPGDFVGLSIKGLDKQSMPKSGDVMIYANDSSLGHASSFKVSVQVLDIPGSIRLGYCPVAFVRLGRAACKLTNVAWKIGKETGGRKQESPDALLSNELAECTFTPQTPLVVDTFRNCEGLSRIAFMDGNGVVMLGKVVQ